jgi:hypothetical protein
MSGLKPALTLGTGQGRCGADHTFISIGIRASRLNAVAPRMPSAHRGVIKPPPRHWWNAPSRCFPNESTSRPNGPARYPNADGSRPNAKRACPNAEARCPNDTDPCPNEREDGPNGPGGCPNDRNPFPNGGASYPNNGPHRPNGNHRDPNGSDARSALRVSAVINPPEDFLVDRPQ